MDQPSLSPQALRRIKAAQLEAGSDLLNGLDAFWHGIGMTTSALREHEPYELIPLFERYAEKLLESEAREWLACFSDPDAYSRHVIMLPMMIAARICPAKAIVPEFPAMDWKDLYLILKAQPADSGRESVLGELCQLSGDWEKHVQHSFSRRFLKCRFPILWPDKQSPVKHLRALFCLKYLFHLRLITIWKQFIHRVCSHLSVQLGVWQAKAYRQMAETVLPPVVKAALMLPVTTQSPTNGGEIEASRLPRKRGPKPDYETATRVAEVVARFATNGDWRSKLDEICDALDEDQVPVPATWRRNRRCTLWSSCSDRDLVIKAIAYRLDVARQKKKPSSETFS